MKKINGSSKYIKHVGVVNFSRYLETYGTTDIMYHLRKSLNDYTLNEKSISIPSLNLLRLIKEDNTSNIES